MQKITKYALQNKANFLHYFFDEGISHDQLHTQRKKSRLARLFRKNSRPATVGVESGNAVYLLGRKDTKFMILSDEKLNGNYDEVSQKY